MPAILFGYLLLPVAAVVVGKAAREAMLLVEAAPVHLAALDAVTLMAVLAGCAVQLRLHGRLSTRRLLAISPVCFASGDVTLAVACWASPGLTTALAAYVWLGVRASFSTAHAALLAAGPLPYRNGACGTAAGAGAIVGWIGGGALTQAVAGTFGAASLVLIVALLTLGMPLLIIVSPRQRVQDTAVVLPRVQGEPGAVHQTPTRIWRSPHLRVVAGLTLCSAATSSLATFQFRSAAVQAVQGADELAVLFGSFQAWVGVVALGVQLVSGPLARRLGRGVDLMLTPVTTGLAALLLLTSGTLAAAVLLRGSDQVFRFSLDRAARERLYGLTPGGTVVDERTFIDAAVFRAGDVAGTLIAIVAVAVLRVPSTWLSLPMLLLVAACVGLALRSRGLSASVART